MKKFLIRLKTIFLLLMIFVVCLTPVFLTLMAFASCLTSITVSAAETTTSETAPPLIYDFGSVPLNVKSKLYSDDELQYPYYFILRISNGKYMVLFFKEKVDYLYVNSESDTYLRSSEKINYKYVITYKYLMVENVMIDNKYKLLYKDFNEFTNNVLNNKEKVRLKLLMKTTSIF